jgi:serine/threonine-protein kinase
MGEVWRAHDTVTDRVVAIKLLHAGLSEDEDFQRRFRREAHAAARLDTPHVVPIYDYGEIDGRLFVSMRLINGRDLNTVLAHGPLDPARAVRIIDQVARALHGAHKVGLLHRDIKPSNILLDDDDFAYLIDFGIARAADETRMTKSGHMIGTFAYIAPERLDPQTEEDARADIYSLACVLYEALTGEPPFPGTTSAHLIAAHLNTPPPRPSATQPNVPAEIDEVIATGMAKDPHLRYGTTIELADAARHVLTTPEQDDADTILDQQATSPAADAAATFPTPTRRAEASPAPDSGDASAKPAVQRPSKLGDRLAWTVPVLALLFVAVLIAVIVGNGSSPPSSRSAQAVNNPQPTKSVYKPQVELPFVGLGGPLGVAVNSAGNVYVADFRNDRVLELPAGSSNQVELPLTVLGPQGVAVDTAGNVFVTDNSGINNDRGVVKLPTGSNSQVTLPFTVDVPMGVAVDSAGNVYVTDGGKTKSPVLQLLAGSAHQVSLPFPGLNNPGGVAVDSAGNVYVAGWDSVWKLPAGSNTPTKLPIVGLPNPTAVAVDTAGNVYVTGSDGAHNDRVLELLVGSSTQLELPFTGLTDLELVAVDTVGNVYVSDANRVLKLPVG